MGFSSAFEPVSQDHLNRKTKAPGKSWKAHTWVNGSVRGSIFSVGVGGHLTSPTEVPSVSQVLLPVPTLLLIVTDNLASSMCKPCSIFTDTVKISGADAE